MSLELNQESRNHLCSGCNYTGLDGRDTNAAVKKQKTLKRFTSPRLRPETHAGIAREEAATLAVSVLKRGIHSHAANEASCLHLKLATGRNRGDLKGQG